MTRQAKWAAEKAKSGKCRQCGKRRGKRGTAQHCKTCAKKHRERMAALMRKRREVKAASDPQAQKNPP